jgi:lysyl-tRNA synthetase class 2
MTGEAVWRPTATVDTLRRRARVLEMIRAFFARRGVLEVETPMLCAATTPDPNIDSLETRVTAPDGAQRVYLHTSPEFAMKRLLAAGYESIYQICKVFRDGEAGRLHNPEFTLLEWYRRGFDHRALMDEVEALLTDVLGTPPAVRRSYREVFNDHVGVDPTGARDAELARCAAHHGLAVHDEHAEDQRDVYLNFLMGRVVTPQLGHEAPVFVYDFPASQAMMARIRPGAPPLAERFEVFAAGIELANGYHELNDTHEQRERFAQERRRRRLNGKPDVENDERLLAAMASGFPDCAGVALGLDRLVMLCTGAAHIEDVIPFPLRLA